MNTTDTRAAFEEWAESEGRTISQWPSGEYEDSLLNSQWDAVQAVAATEAAKGKGRYCAHCQREADNECKNCKGYGVVTHISGMTPDNYEECNEVCPDCEGEGAVAAKATGTAGELTDNFQQAWAKFSDGTHKSPRDIGLHFWEAAMRYAEAGNEEFRKDVKRLTERCRDVQAENLAFKAEAARQPAPVVIKERENE